MRFDTIPLMRPNRSEPLVKVSTQVPLSQFELTLKTQYIMMHNSRSFINPFHFIDYTTWVPVRIGLSTEPNDTCAIHSSSVIIYISHHGVCRIRVRGVASLALGQNAKIFNYPPYFFFMFYEVL